MHLENNLANELLIRNEAWVMINATIYFTDDNGTSHLSKLISKNIFFYLLSNGKTLMTSAGMADRLLDKTEIAEINDLVYFEQPLNIIIFNEIKSLAKGETVKISSRLVSGIIPEQEKTLVFCRWQNLLLPQRRCRY